MPTDSPLSLVITNLVLQNQEKKALNTSAFPFLRCLRRWHCNGSSSRKNYRNMTSFQFVSSSITVHDWNWWGQIKLFRYFIIIKKNNILEYDWYHKPTFSGKYLNFFSQHPVSQKRGTIIGMVDRAFLLCQSKYHKKNLIFVIKTLLNNDYPIDFIFNIINERLKSLLSNKTWKQNTNDTFVEDIVKKLWFTIPFVSYLRTLLAICCVQNEFVARPYDYCPTVSRGIDCFEKRIWSRRFSLLSKFYLKTSNADERVLQ